MRRLPSVRSAMFLAVVSPPHEQGKKTTEGPKGTARALGVSTSKPSSLTAFLQMTPEEKFDIEAVNAIDLAALVGEAHGDKHVLREVIRTAEALLPRVRAETEDPILVSAILRAKTFDWYRRSAADPNWAETVPLRWGGIFHESRVPGGRLRRKLSARISSLINQCVEASGTVAFLRAGVGGLFRGSAVMASIMQFALGSKRPRLTQQVAQAYLDDLASTARDGDQPLPLERLSDLGKRSGSQEVNMTLVDLFPQEGAGVLTVLDPRFHPGMSALAIHVVPQKSSEDAATYDLVQGPARSPKEAGSLDVASTETSAGSPWERPDISKKDWLGVLKALEKRKARLEAPPRENPRDRDSYLSLKELLLTDGSGRKAFLAVHWKGKPAGLALLCQLLSEGSLSPEVETDADYLEAEMDHPEKSRADRRPKEGQWNLGHGWMVTRETTDGRVRTYRASAKSGD